MEKEKSSNFSIFKKISPLFLIIFNLKKFEKQHFFHLLMINEVIFLTMKSKGLVRAINRHIDFIANISLIKK